MTKTYHCVVIEELNHHNRGALCQHGGITIELNLFKDKSLVPGGAQGLIQHLVMVVGLKRIWSGEN